MTPLEANTLIEKVNTYLEATAYNKLSAWVEVEHYIRQMKLEREVKEHVKRTAT